MSRWGTGVLLALIVTVLVADVALLFADEGSPGRVVTGVTAPKPTTPPSVSPPSTEPEPTTTAPTSSAPPTTAPSTTAPPPSLIGKILFSARTSPPDPPTTGPVTPSAKGYDVFVIDGNGQNRRQITTRGRDVQPDLSPDGRSIAWISGADNEIWTMDGNGANRRKLADCPLSCGSPKWSPTGDRIAYASFSGSDGDPQDDDVVVMKADGSQARRFPTERQEYDVAWSPDGKRLVVDVHYEPHFGLWVLDVASAAWTKILDQQALSPDWSPDGKTILWLDHRSRINAISPDGSGSRLVAASEEQILYVIWTRDGGSMLYVSRPQTRDGKYRFALRKADGTGERFITDGSFDVGRPSV